MGTQFPLDKNRTLQVFNVQEYKLVYCHVYMNWGLWALK